MSDKNNVVLTRFQELVNQSGKTRQQIAKDLKCDTSTVTKQYNGDIKISVDYLVKYSKYFSVSTDYLLGLSNAATNDDITRKISEQTGLTTQSIKNIKQAISIPNDIHIPNSVDFIIKNKVFWINQLVNNPYAESMFSELTSYLLAKSKEEKNPNSKMKLFLMNETAEFKLFTASKTLAKIADSVWLSDKLGFPNPISDISKDVEEICEMLEYIEERGKRGNN